MIRKDYHMHTSRCDGNASAEEMVLSAIEKGMEEIGISGHSHTSFDETYCMSHDSTREYYFELEQLKEKYGDSISIKTGLEMDRYADADTSGCEYLIGSVHYIRIADEDMEEPLPQGFFRGKTEEDRKYIYVSIDESAEILKKAADTYFGGDIISLAEKYFDTVGGIAEATGCTIIGHFDLITKFNEGNSLFDDQDPRYVAAWRKAADRLLPSGIPFEINTGAIAKGYRTAPYPSKDIWTYIKSKGGQFILSSDSHKPETIAFAFDEYETYVI